MTRRYYPPPTRPTNENTHLDDGQASLRCVSFLHASLNTARVVMMAKRIFILFSFFYLRSEENYYYYYYVKGKEELSERLGIHSQKQLDKQSIDKTARHLRSIVRSDVPHRVDGVEKVERDKYGK